MKTILIQNADINATKKMYEVYGDNLAVSTVFHTIQGEGPLAGHCAIFVRLAGCNFGKKDAACNFCFPSTKLIQTPQGTRQIKDIQVGDYLFALDNEFKLTTTKVKKKIQRRVYQSEFVRVSYMASKRIGGDLHRHSIVCTAEHPFHVKDKGFIAAKDLDLDDIIYHVKGNEIQSLQKKLNNPMYDVGTRQQVAATRKKNKQLGKDKSYVRSKWHRTNLSELRKVVNPMFDTAAQLKMIQNKVYKKSAPEIFVESMFKAIEIKAKYVGNKRKYILGDASVGYSRPDFILGNKVFEVYDTTFPHYVEGLRTKENYEVPKRKFYKALGYEVMFITQNTFGGKFKLTNASLAKFGMAVNKFLKNGAKVVGVEYLDGKGFSQLDVGSDAKVEVTNFSCAPYNTFVIDNLHTHNCDTSFQLDKARIISPQDLLNEILALPQYDKSQVLVITGGEPTLQHNLLAFITWASPYFSAIQIETNGTQASFYAQAEKMGLSNNFKSVVSPKASNKTGKYAPLSKTVLWWATCLKFVVSSDPDSPHHDIPEWALESGKPIFVSPMAVYAKGYEGEISSIWEVGLLDKEATRANYSYAAMLTLKYNLLLSIQQHLFVELP